MCPCICIYFHNCLSLISLYVFWHRASGKEYPQFYTNHLAFWLEISDFCTGLPSSVLLARPNSYESERVSRSVVWLFAILWTAAYQVPLSMKFSRQECWSGLPFPSPRHLPDPGIEPRSPALQADSLSSEPREKPKILCMGMPKLGIWVQGPGSGMYPQKCCHLVEICCKLSGCLHYLGSLMTASTYGNKFGAKTVQLNRSLKIN